ncbi:hypothetical protein B0H11DRAFT_1009864 [Mycena galericulata]|nr:hypothetical protein B0H11DRAFT_1009864 [Mycena galericulata]
MARSQRTSAPSNPRGGLSGRISALSESLRLHRGQGGGVHDDGGEEAETESIASTLIEDGDMPPSSSYTSGRGGLGNFHPQGPPSSPDDIPWPRGRPRERTRRGGGGSQSTGRGGYGNITSAPHNLAWSYSTQEQEILRAHAEARRGAIPVGRGGYGNIAHARALAQAAEEVGHGRRSHSADPVAAPTSMTFSIPVPPVFRRREKKTVLLNGHDERHGSDAETISVDEEAEDE